METRISAEILSTNAGRKANEELRKCVHCGFCLATCPTYQILGDELDSPRGRIYLIKSLLEGEADEVRVHKHLDRCLTCRACETTCPSGVEYGRLLDVGREHLAENATNISFINKVYRWLIRKTLTSRQLFNALCKIGTTIRPLLPTTLKRSLPVTQTKADSELNHHKRRVILFRGCVQEALRPATNQVASSLLNHFGVSAIEVKQEQCCGALSHHLSATAEARQFMRQNIDSWWPYIEDGIEAIINTASGCGVMLKDYGYLLKDDKDYAERAAVISSLCRDISEYLDETLPDGLILKAAYKNRRIAWHNPCTLQHGQKVKGLVASLLAKHNVQLSRFSQENECCGSAGAYSLLQKKLSHELQQKKLASILEIKPDIIITANIGCQIHLQAGTALPVLHWIELFEPSTSLA